MKIIKLTYLIITKGLVVKIYSEIIEKIYTTKIFDQYKN